MATERKIPNKGILQNVSVNLSHDLAMLFEDLDTLNEMIDLVRSGADNRQHINMSHVKDINKTKSARRFRDLNVR